MGLNRTNEWVRMKTIFGLSVMPPASAAIVARAVNRAVAVGDVARNARWQFVEWMAVEYMHEQRQSLAELRGEPVDARPIVSAASPAFAYHRATECTTDEERFTLMAFLLRTVGYDDAVDVLEQREVAAG
jgi:hypothetical protein